MKVLPRATASNQPGSKTRWREATNVRSRVEHVSRVGIAPRKVLARRGPARDNRPRRPAPRGGGHRGPSHAAGTPYLPRRSRRCDQEVSKRTLATPRKVCEEVSQKEMWNHCEPCDVQVSLPGRADESSEVRSSGNNVLTSANLDAEVDEGRPGRLNARKESF
jgi:hypothetical protein